MAYLVFVRHGLSEYNKKGLWTGWDDPNLAPEGEKEAVVAAKTIADIHFDAAFASPLIRHKETIEIIKKTLSLNLPITISDELKERNYGIYTGKNKWEVKKEVGDQEFKKMRRGWDYPIPEGESLKQVYNRAAPYFEKTIKPLLLSGKNVIVSSSGNVLRSLVKHVENISDEDIMNVDIAPGEVYIYTIGNSGKVINKEIRNHHENTI